MKTTTDRINAWTRTRKMLLKGVWSKLTTQRLRTKKMAKRNGERGFFAENS